MLDRRPPSSYKRDTLFGCRTGSSGTRRLQWPRRTTRSLYGKRETCSFQSWATCCKVTENGRANCRARPSFAQKSLDLHLEIPVLSHAELTGGAGGESCAVIRARVLTPGGFSVLEPARGTSP